METIAAACISSFAAIIACLINNNFQNRETRNQLAKHSELQAYRIEQLEIKVEKHNNVLERTFNLEKEQLLQEEQIKFANNRIKDLERFHEKRSD